MRIALFSEHCKFNVGFKNAKKMQQKISAFLDNLIWIGTGKFSLLVREYSYVAGNVLSNSPKISDLTKNNLLQLNLAQNDETVG